MGESTSSNLAMVPGRTIAARLTASQSSPDRMCSRGIQSYSIFAGAGVPWIRQEGSVRSIQTRPTGLFGPGRTVSFRLVLDSLPREFRTRTGSPDSSRRVFDLKVTKARAFPHCPS